MDSSRKPDPNLLCMAEEADAEVAMSFVTDVNLGRLARWLRILGYDTRFDRGEVNRDFLRRAQQENRIVLTRKQSLINRQFRGRLVVIENDLVHLQIPEVMQKLKLDVRRDSLYRRCSLCNDLLEIVSADQVENLVSDYVLHRSGPFKKCRGCARIYWVGGHREMAVRFLRQHIPDHLL